MARKLSRPSNALAWLISPLVARKTLLQVLCHADKQKAPDLFLSNAKHCLTILQRIAARSAVSLKAMVARRTITQVRSGSCTFEKGISAPGTMLQDWPWADHAGVLQ